MPEAEGTARVTFAPPRRPDVLAGVTPFRLVATSHQNPQAATFADGTVTVGGYHELATQLRSARAEDTPASYGGGRSLGADLGGRARRLILRHPVDHVSCPADASDMSSARGEGARETFIFEWRARANH